MRPRFSFGFELRHPPQFGRTGKEIYAAALDMCAWADEHGFVRASFGEHHQSTDGYIPAPLVFAAALGGRTRNLRVRVSVLLAALYNPVRLAEEAAVADLCLQGRLDLGMGVGYVEADFDMFGADYRRRGRTLEELIPFLRQAWTGEPFEHNSQTIRVTPKPAQDPMPIYVGGASKAAIERAARLADGYLPPGMSKPWDYYRRACERFGKPDPGPYPKLGPIFVWVTTGNKDKAWEQLAPHIRHQIATYAEWTVKGHGKPDGPFIPTNSLDDLKQGGAYQVLDPDEAIALAHDLGPDGEFRLNPLLSGIDPAYAWEMLRTLETHVLPALS